MKVIVCMDDNFGMLFNQRRQSRDKVLLEDVFKATEKVWIHSFSEKLFVDYADRIIVDDAFLEKAGEKDVCFVENQRLTAYREKINQLIVYKWNRKYPADFYLDLNLGEWNLEETVEFAGKSHEKITREIYN